MSKTDLVQQLKVTLHEKRDALQEAAPPHLSITRLNQIAMVAIQSNPYLLKCSVSSLMVAIFDAARYGLIPNSLTQEGHLVPFYSSKSKCYEAQFIAGYKGLIKLARKSGSVDEHCGTITRILAAPMIRTAYGKVNAGLFHFPD